MRKVDTSNAFERDFSRTLSMPRYRKDLESILSEVISTLAADIPLPSSYRDHPLKGDWFGYRECHIKPDLLLFYRKSDLDTLLLARLGSHSQLLDR